MPEASWVVCCLIVKQSIFLSCYVNEYILYNSDVRGQNLFASMWHSRYSRYSGIGLGLGI